MMLIIFINLYLIELKYIVRSALDRSKLNTKTKSNESIVFIIGMA